MPVAISTDPTDLQAMQESLSDAARRLRTGWLLLVSTSTYLGLAANNITDRDLLFQTAMALPLLNINLGVVPFGVVAPLLVTILLLNFLVGLAFVAERADEYKDLLRAQVRIRRDRIRMNQRISASLFAQILLGSESFGRRAWLRPVSMIVFAVTTLIVPIGVVYLFLVKFLPYQSEAITWLQRATLGISVIAPTLVLPRVLRESEKHSDAKPSNLGKWTARVAFLILLSIATAAAALVPRFPGEWLSDQIQFEVLPFRSHLILRDEVLTDEQAVAALDAADAPMSSSRPKLVRDLSRRSLVNAVFDRSDLRRVNFAGARLAGASFREARLGRAAFGCLPSDAPIYDLSQRESKKDGVLNPKCADLTGADLTEANLHETWMESTLLHGVNLREAILFGTVLSGSELVGANLSRVVARGAHFDQVDLTGASLFNARLEASVLTHVSLKGADLYETSFAFSRMENVDFTGASLTGASLQGASLSKLLFSSTDLRWVKIGGAVADEQTVLSLLSSSLPSLIWRLDTTPKYRKLSGQSHRRPQLRDWGWSFFPDKDVLLEDLIKNGETGEMMDLSSFVEENNDDLDLSKIENGDLETNLFSGTLFETTRIGIRQVVERTHEKRRSGHLLSEGILKHGQKPITSDHLQAMNERIAIAKARIACRAWDGAQFSGRHFLWRIAEGYREEFANRVSSEDCRNAQNLRPLAKAFGSKQK